MKSEKSYLLDTSFLIDLVNREDSALDVHEKIRGTEVTATVCVYELSKFSRFDPNERFGGKEVLDFTVDDAAEAGKVYRETSADGKRLSEMDALIAGTARNRDLTLVTRDADFERVDDLDLKLYGLEN